MPKSAVTAVYVIDTLPRDQYDKVLRGTILKSWIKDNYVFCQMTFNKFYGPNRSLEQAFDITNMPSDVDAYFMIVYTNSSIDQRGAALSIAHLQNGHLTCTNPKFSQLHSK